MREEKLYEAITLIDDDLIDETARYAPKQKHSFHWKRWAALAACLVLAVGVVGVFRGLWGGLGGSSADSSSGSSGMGSGSDGSSTFMSYAGPVFPLTALSNADGVTAQRDITLNFLPWVSAAYSTDILVTDSYTLSNSTGEDKTLTVLYPFSSSLLALDERLPSLTADGAELESDLLFGPYSGGFEGVMGQNGPSEELFNLAQLSSWDEYKALLSDGSYLEKTLAGFPDLSGIDVIVYEFTGAWGPAESAAVPNPSIRVTFDLDYDDTTVLSYGFDSGFFDRENGMMGRGFSIPQPQEPNYGKPDYLIILGDDIENMEIWGAVTGGWDSKKELDDFGLDVERYETDLDAILRQVTSRQWENMQAWDCGMTAVDYETYHGLFCDYQLTYGVLAEGGVNRFGTGQLEDQDVINVDRVCYLKAEVTIPAGESVTLSAQMTKPASFDYDCARTENRDISGYDLVTRLGSTLTFTGQTATLEDHGQIEIVRQNFGFDLEQGIRTVELDADTEHYYLEVKRLE